MREREVMMRKPTLMLLALLALLAASAAWALTARYSSGTSGISVTQSNTTTSFTDNHSGGSGSAFNARFVTVCSRSTSTNPCFVDFDGTATTADWRIAPGACLSVTYSGTSGGDGWPSIGSICNTGETATFDINAGR